MSDYLHDRGTDRLLADVGAAKLAKAMLEPTMPQRPFFEALDRGAAHWSDPAYDAKGYVRARLEARELANLRPCPHCDAAMKHEPAHTDDFGDGGTEEVAEGWTCPECEHWEKD